MLARRTERERRFWVWILALAPLAGLLGTYLEVDRARRDQIYLQISRAESERIARNVARQQGVDVQGWSAFSGVSVKDQLHFYYRDQDSDSVRRIRRLAPAAVIQVSLINPEGSSIFQVRLSTDGRVLGFSRPRPGGEAEVSFLRVSSTGTSTEEEVDGAVETDTEWAERMARNSFEARLGELPGIEFRGPDRSRRREGGRELLDFSWRGGDQEHEELRLHYLVTVAGDRISAEDVTAELSQEYADEHFPANPWFRVVATTVMTIVAVLLSVYALFLYLRRSRQREVSHRRNLLLGMLVAIGFTLVAILGSIDSLATQLNRNTSDPNFVIALVAISFAYAFVGAYCGLMWGSGEGEVREAFPGKLTSLDALVLGRWFSRNVAAALTIGTALGLWLLLILNVVQLPWADSPQFGFLPSSQAPLTYLRFSGLLLLTPIVSAIPVSILGLLVPITWAWRWIQSRRLRLAFLSVLATLGCLWFGLQMYPFPAGVAATVVTAAFLMVSFLYFDLLTTIATISAWNAISNLVSLGTNTSFGMSTVILGSLGFGVFLLAELYFAFHGRRYSEVEVRPLYAEHLAQRQALQAEVSAAREAQLRLAPQAIPEIEGLRIAAVCRPSRTVGGDFYDFFQVGETRLGFFLAEGGDGGLSAALSIAFAKGLLLPMARKGASVEDMISELDSRLEPLHRSNPRMGILLGVLDLESGILEHSRMGGYPRLVLVRGSGDQLRLQAREEDSPAGDSRISGCTVQLCPDDRIICFTDGMSATLEASRKLAVEDWLEEFFRRDPAGNHWQAEFEKALQPQIRRARQRGVDDDVSTILLHFEHSHMTRKQSEEVA